MHAASLLVLALAAAEPSADWAALHDTHSPSVPLLFSRGGLCAGALVEERLVLTAWHCVAALDTVHVRWVGEEEVVRAEVVAHDRENDLALVRLPFASGRKPLPVRPSDEPVRIGEPIAVIGHPLASTLWEPQGFDERFNHALTTGHVAKVSKRGLSLDVRATFGNSGGPVLDAKGRIIGVSSAIPIALTGGGLLLAPGPEALQALLARTQREEPAPVPFTDATSRLELNLGALWAGGSGAASGLVTAYGEVEFLAFSRVRLSYLSGLDFTQRDRPQVASLGYSFKVDVSPLLVLGLTPKVGYAWLPQQPGPGFAPNLAGVRAELLGMYVDAGVLLQGVNPAGYQVLLGVTALSF